MKHPLDNLLLRTFVVGALGAGTLLLCATAPDTVSGESAGLVMELPHEILGIASEPIPASQAEKDSLPPDTGFEKRNYSSADGRLFLSYSIVLSGESRNSIHRPEVCLPGQGWAIMGEEIRPVDLPDGRVFHVKDLSLERDYEGLDGKRGTLRAHYYYWFVGRDVTTPRHLTRILLTSYDNVFRNVNHRWAYVSLMSYVGDSFQRGEGVLDSEGTQKIMDEFIAASIDEFQTAF